MIVITRVGPERVGRDARRPALPRGPHAPHSSDGARRPTSHTDSHTPTPSHSTAEATAAFGTHVRAWPVTPPRFETISGCRPPRRTPLPMSPSSGSTTRCRLDGSPNTIRPPSHWWRHSGPWPTPGSPTTRSTGWLGRTARRLRFELGLGPCTRRPTSLGIPALLDAAALITTRAMPRRPDRRRGSGCLHRPGATAPWTRPANEFVVGYGLFTAAEFALMARRHMIVYGTTPEQMAAGRDRPEQRARQPRRRVHRSRSVHSRRHPARRGWSRTRSISSSAP